MKEYTVIVNSHHTFKVGPIGKAAGIKPFNYFNVTIEEWNIMSKDYKDTKDSVNVMITNVRDPILYSQIKVWLNKSGYYSLNEIKEPITCKPTLRGGTIHHISYFSPGPDIPGDDTVHDMLRDEINSRLSQNNHLTNKVTWFGMTFED